MEREKNERETKYEQEKEEGKRNGKCCTYACSIYGNKINIALVHYEQRQQSLFSIFSLARDYYAQTGFLCLL